MSGKTSSPLVLLAVSVLTVAGAGRIGAAEDGFQPIQIPDPFLTAGFERTDEPGWFPYAGIPHDLAGFPTGRQTLADVEWQIPEGRALMLSGAGSQIRTPRVEGIPVGRRADALHFLHTFNAGPGALACQQRAAAAKERGEKPAEPPAVFRYFVHYADGQAMEVPVRWGEGVSHWVRTTFWDPLYGFLYDLKWARVAWSEPTGPNTGRSKVVYGMEWPNPRPEKEIASIEVLSANDREHDWGAPAVLAISAETSARPGTNYYVAPDGHDTGPGSFDRPWGTVPHAVKRLKPGDTLYLRGGRYPVNELIMVQNSGEEDRWITISAYSGETPVLDARGMLPPKDADGWNDLPNAILRVTREAKYVRVRGLHFERSINYGLATTSEYVDFLFNTVYRTYHTGMWASGRHVRSLGNTLIRACDTRTFYDFIEEYPNLLESPQIASMKEQHDRGRRLRHEALDCGSTGSEHVECAYNEIAHSDKEGIDCKGGPRHVRIHHNYVHHITFYTGLYVDCWTQPMRHVEVHHNVVGNNRGSGIQISSEGGPVLEGLTVRNNVCFCNKFSGILLGAPGRNGPRRDIRIANNTVFHNGYAHPNRNPGGGIHVGTKNVTDLIIRNNICFDNKDYAIVTRGQDLAENDIRIEHNLCYLPRELGMIHPTYFSLLGENSVQAHPMFVDPIGLDFRLRADSPAIDAGHPEDEDTDGTRADLGAISFVQAK